MKQSRWNIDEWLAMPKGYIPDGKHASSARRIEPGDITLVVNLIVERYGGYHTPAYAGQEPKLVRWLKDREKSIGMRDAVVGLFRVEAPCVIHSVEGNSRTGQSSSTVLICATDEQIEDARRRVTARQQVEAAIADLGVLKEYLQERWRLAINHNKQWLRESGCMCGDPASHGRHSTHWVRRMIEDGKVDEVAILSMPPAVTAALRKVCALSRERREAFLVELRSDFKAEDLELI